ncbi:MAG: hypothetical protein ACK6CT_05885 [Planctomycetia bacterium]
MVAATKAAGEAPASCRPGSGVRPRPPVFRALGDADPPAQVEIDGEVFRRCEILKHDSWAATGIYASATRRAICKFNRRQSILRLPMAWLGRRLAAREQGFMDRLAGIDGVPPSLGPVCVAGRRLENAVSRQFIAGHALRVDERVNAEFFPRFDRLLAEVHRRDVAHVELHKRENIQVDEAGRPHLIDFQISFALPAGNRIAARALRGVLHVLQQCDDYHLLKHRMKHAPEPSRPTARDIDRMRPWWIRLHRSVAVPFRTVRRQCLVWLGIRARSGQAGSEWFPEVAHR